MSTQFKIGNITIGRGKPCFIMAEVAQAHDGSLGMAHAFIDAVAAAGADAIKFQTHIAAAESTPQEPWRVKFSKQDASRYDYWKRMEFSEAQWQDLKQHADERGLVFLSSPFSSEAVDLLTAVGVSAWKIPSGEITSTPILEKILATGLPLILSTGMSPLNEIDKTVELITKNSVPFVLLQCTTAYPCPPEKIGFNLIPFFQERYNCAVGLSDHSGTIYPGLAAAAIGIQLLEVHVTFSREMFGPDVPASLTTAELRQLVDGIRFVEKMMAHPVDKEAIASEFKELRSTFTKSIVACKNLKAGRILKADDLTLKKPGTGMPAERLSEIIGRRLKRPVAVDHFISEEDID